MMKCTSFGYENRFVRPSSSLLIYGSERILCNMGSHGIALLYLTDQHIKPLCCSVKPRNTRVCLVPTRLTTGNSSFFKNKIKSISIFSCKAMQIYPLFSVGVLASQL